MSRLDDEARLGVLLTRVKRGTRTNQMVQLELASQKARTDWLAVATLEGETAPWAASKLQVAAALEGEYYSASNGLTGPVWCAVQRI